VHPLAEIDVHRLDVSVIFQGILSKLATNSALLETTEWYISIEHVDAVDPNSSGLELVCSHQGTIDILGKDGGSESVYAVVGLADDIFLILELDDHTNGPEDLLLDDLHIWLGFRENCWLDVITLGPNAVTAKMNGRTFILSRLNVPHDAIKLELGDLWPLVGVRSEGVADLDRL